MSEVTTVSDLESVDWHKILASSRKKTCLEFHFALARGRDAAAQEAKWNEERALALVSAICSMMLQPELRDDPFKPLATFTEGRTFIADDLTPDQLEGLSRWRGQITDAELAARVSDLLWVRRRDRTSAEAAVRAYIKSAKRLSEVADWHDSGDRFDRALSLALSLKNTQLISSVTRSLKAGIRRAEARGEIWFLRRLLECLLRHPNRSVGDHAALCERIAEQAARSEGWFEAREFWQLASKWHSRFGRQVESEQARVQVAETYVSEGMATESMLSRASFLNRALDELRDLRRARDRFEEVKAIAVRAQSEVGFEMAEFSVPISIPASAWNAQLEAIREFVKAKPLPSTLVALGQLFSIEKVSKLRADAEQMMREFPIRFLASSLTIGDNGKVVSRFGSSRDAEQEQEGRLRNEMFRNRVLARHIAVLTTLEPAREQILLEHPLNLPVLMRILNQCPLIPRGRLYSFSRGIMEGLRGDAVAASQILLPQLENAFRRILEQRGMTPFRVNRDGSQYELDLNTMLYMPELEDFLGEDLTFELRGLLVESCSSNLRNRVMHGLVDDDEMPYGELAFAWWATLYLLMATTPTLLKEYQEATSAASS